MAKAKKRVEQFDIDQAAEVVLAAFRSEYPNTLHSWLDRLQSFLCMADGMPLDALNEHASKRNTDPATEYVKGYIRNLHSLATICTAWLVAYPDSVANDIRQTLGRVLRVADDHIRNIGTVYERCKLLRQDPLLYVIEGLAADLDGIDRDIQRQADTIAAIDAERGEPQVPAAMDFNGNATFAELAERVRNAAGPKVEKPISIDEAGVVTFHGKQYRSTSPTFTQAMQRLIEAYPKHVRADNTRWGKVRASWGTELGNRIKSVSGAGGGAYLDLSDADSVQV
jgi:hypothetical protein